jgi:hypothetical protein
MALAARPQHDIILRPSIPLAATSDVPLVEPVRPPESASNDQDDQKSGVPQEISPEEAAAAAAARKGDPATGEMKDEQKPKPKTEAKTGDDPDKGEDDGIEVDEAAPFWAKKQIAEIRKKASDRVKAIREATKAEVGDDKWNQAWEAANSNVVGRYRDEVAKAQAEARRVTAEREAIAAEKEALAKKVAEIEATGNQEQPKQDPRPSREDFDDPDLYAEALVAWGKRDQQREFEATQAAAKAEADRIAAEEKAVKDKEAADEQEKAIAEENAKIALDWQTKTAAAQEKYGDYDEIVMRAPADGGPTVTEMMAQAMTRTDNGPDVAYFLALNPEESVRIAELKNPLLQYGEIMKLSGRLSAPTARQQARLPRPIKTIDSGRVEPQSPNPDDEDMESYAARRSKELMATRRPFFPNGGLH